MTSPPYWWDLIPSALGAVLGAGAGAIPAYFLAQRSSRETLKRDQEARTQLQKSNAVRMLVKLLQAVNSALSVHMQVEQTIQDGDAKGLETGLLWQKLPPFAGLSEKGVTFDADEVAVLFVAKRADLANRLMLFAERHSTHERALIDYTARRRSLGDAVGAKMHGEIGTRFLSPEEQILYGPRSAELEIAATNIRTVLGEDAAEAVGLLREIAAAMNNHFESTEFFKLDLSLLSEPGSAPSSSSG